ncbi:MAG: hypothetical protein MRJ65_01800 [Candidatus Brocadiaceae bacterium]|nr:hypothetical protein [Candidatus Brocadiaceae bacterium]
MKNDPIVEEIRKTRQKIFDNCNQDLSEYINWLKEEEKQDADKIISFEIVQKDK